MSTDEDEFKIGFGNEEDDAVFGEEVDLDLDDALLDDDGEIIDEDDEEGFAEEFSSDDSDAI
ncbi:MAG: hypothetical protein KBD48_03095 [Candidatus Pacebacteria bacterium]|nr:hypothetical protein [Candidatus Paceibacterota bacterium]MBP9716146.1 hypothetical protein [Candidatus Paceibacterota bacterium]